MITKKKEKNDVTNVKNAKELIHYSIVRLVMI